MIYLFTTTCFKLDNTDTKPMLILKMCFFTWLFVL